MERAEGEGERRNKEDIMTIRRKGMAQQRVEERKKVFEKNVKRSEERKD